jgi:hypothetical protein
MMASHLLEKRPRSPPLPPRRKRGRLTVITPQSAPPSKLPDLFDADLDLEVEMAAIIDADCVGDPRSDVDGGVFIYCRAIEFMFGSFVTTGTAELGMAEIAIPGVLNEVSGDTIFISSRASSLVFDC